MMMILSLISEGADTEAFTAAAFTNAVGFPSLLIIWIFPSFSMALCGSPFSLML